MDEAVRELVLGWLTKARHDLASARILGSGSSPVLDTAIYHCQQAAEKALKGFLLYHGEPFGKTHDLEVLVKLAAQIDAGFSSWQEVAIALTPYATQYRYPGVADPDFSEFKRAFDHATAFCGFVFSRLPDIKLISG